MDVTWLSDYLRLRQTDLCDQSILIFHATSGRFDETKLDFRLLCFTLFNLNNWWIFKGTDPFLGGDFLFIE